MEDKDTGEFHAYDGKMSTFDYRRLKNRNKRKWYMSLSQSNMERGFVFLPNPDYGIRPRNWLKRGALHMMQYYCRMGYQAWIKDANWNRVVGQHDDIWLRRTFYQIEYGPEFIKRKR